MLCSDLPFPVPSQDGLQSLLESTRLEAAAWRRRAGESEASLKETVSELQKNNLVVCELTEQVNALRYVWGAGWVWVWRWAGT